MQGSSATISRNSVGAPDGSLTAGTATATSGSINSNITDNVPNPALYSVASVTVSIWLKVPTGTLSTLLSVLETGDQGPATVGVINVTLTTTWQKFQVTGTAQNGLTMLCLQMGGSNTFASGNVIDFWGAGMQFGSAIGSTVTNFLPYSQQWNTLSWGTLALGQAVADSASNNLFTAPDGTYSGFKITANSGSTNTYVADLVQSPATYNSTQVTGSVYLRVPSGTQNINLYLLDGTSGAGSAISQTTVQLTTAWQRFQLTATTGTNLGVLSLQLGGGNSVTSGQVVDVWGAQMEAAPAAGQYVPTLDTPVTAAADSTNLLPSSEQVGAGGWSISNATLSGNISAVAAPNGSHSADAITSTAAGPTVQDAVASPDLYGGATVTASVYLAVPSGTPSINIHIYNQNAAGLTSIVSQSVALSSTWQRFSVTGTNLNGLTKLYLQIGDSTSFPSGETIYAWGAQMVLGSSADAFMYSTNTTTNYATGATAYLAANGLNQSYSYDAFGNMQQSGNFNFAQAYTAANQLAGWNYDASGNLLSDAYNNTYAYDSEGQNTGGSLSSGGSVRYIYDAAGQRIEKDYGSATDTIFFGGEPLARYSGGAWTDLIYGPSGCWLKCPARRTGLRSIASWTTSALRWVRCRL